MQLTHSLFFNGLSLNFIKFTPQIGSFFFKVLWRKCEATTSPSGPALTLNFLINLSCLTLDAWERSSLKPLFTELNADMARCVRIMTVAQAATANIVLKMFAILQLNGEEVKEFFFKNIYKKEFIVFALKFLCLFEFESKFKKKFLTK